MGESPGVQTMIPALRDCQNGLLDAIIEQYRLGHRRVLARADTGFGKTIVFCAITLRSMQKGKRVVITAHRAEIVEQISRALDSFGVRHGRIQTGHSMTNDPIQVSMVITLGKRMAQMPEPDLLVIDECHHACGGSYKTITNTWQKARVLGVTATPNRLDGRGLDDSFDVMVEAIPMSELISLGYLAPYTYLAPPSKVDLTNVSTRNGDFDTGELAAAMDRSVITGDAVAHAQKYLSGRPAVVFAVTVEHAWHVAEQFAAAGFRAASVDGSVGKVERRDRIAAIGDGRLDILTSCELISEGTDLPVVGGAILLRPTKSLALHLQQVGRVLRPKPDGSKAVILDHVGNIKHGLPDAPRQWTLKARKKRPAAGAVTQCEVCYRVFATKPGWRQEILDTEGPCEQPGEPDCALRQPDIGAGRSTPDEEAGALQEFATTPEWAGGLNVASARGNDWYALLRRAETFEQLDQIRKARGYHWKWARQVMAARERKRA